MKLNFPDKCTIADGNLTGGHDRAGYLYAAINSFPWSFPIKIQSISHHIMCMDYSRTVEGFHCLKHDGWKQYPTYGSTIVTYVKWRGHLHLDLLHGQSETGWFWWDTMVENVYGTSTCYPSFLEKSSGRVDGVHLWYPSLRTTSGIYGVVLTRSTDQDNTEPSP